MAESSEASSGVSGPKGPVPISWTLEGLRRSLGLGADGTRDAIAAVIAGALGERLGVLVELGEVSGERIVLLGGSPHVTAALRLRAPVLRRALSAAGYLQRVDIKNA